MNSVSSSDFEGEIYLNQVREALWDQRASVLIGSGFSRNARKRRARAAPMPTWLELGRSLDSSLGQQGTRRPEAGPAGAAGTTDPVKLAQAYEDTFGRPALNRFLMQHVRDDDFVPGEVHRRLLTLPWCDVFSTNWDTLLERCSRENHFGYGVLERPSGLQLVKRPRIVKLHGSFPHCDPLIATEEDYRTYPDCLAPFVDLARLAMMETTFLLLGFSCDDANFKQWSGWVRDNLGAAAPTTYLAGWLALREPQRRYLLARNIVPVDFKQHGSAASWPECEAARHELAMEWILRALEGPPSYELQRWPEPRKADGASPVSFPSTDSAGSYAPRLEPWPDSSASDESERLKEVRKITAIWRHNRECYPNWLVLPFDAAPKLRSLTDSWEDVIIGVLPVLGDAAERLPVIRELVWRRETLLDPLLQELEAALLEVFDDVDCVARTIGGKERDDLDWTAITEQWKIVAAYLVTSARHDFDRDTFDLRAARLDPFLAEDHELRHRLHHEECLWSLNRQDWENLEELLERWRLSEHDQAWRLRKAALLVELNDNGAALGLIDEVIEAVRGWRNDGTSMAEPSMESWALCLKHGLAGDALSQPYEGWREYVPYRCDLLRDIRRHEREVTWPGKKSRPKPFELGAVPGRRVTFSNVPSLRAKAALRAIRFTEVAGVPPAVFGRWQYGVGSALLEGVGEALRPYISQWTIWLTARCATGPSEENAAHVLSRSRMAFLGRDLARELAAAQRALIAKGLEQIPAKRGGIATEFWRVRVTAGMEILSRCVVRLPTDEVEEVLELARRLYGDARVTAHFGLWKPLQHLVRRSWEALPSPLQAEHALSLLSLPIVGLGGFSVDRPVANFRDPAWLMSRAPGRRSCPAPERSEANEEQWRAAIDLIHRGLKSGGEARKRAGVRLARMSQWKQFTASEEKRLAASLWGFGWQEDEELPEGAGVYPWVFVDLPEPQNGIALERLRAPWSRPRDWNKEGQKPLEEFLAQAGSSLRELREGGVDLVLSEGEAGVLRAAVEQWAERDLWPVLPWMFENGETRWRATRAVAQLLLRFRVSEGAASSLGERVKRLRREEVPAHELVPGILNSAPEQVEWLAWEMRLGLADTASERLLSAVHGLFLWLEAEKNGEPALPPVPATVLQEIGVIVANRRWEALGRALEVSEWVFREGTGDQQNVLRAPVLEGLGRLLQEIVYEEDVDQHPFMKRPWVDHEQVDVPLLRWRCARTAWAMKAAGLGDEHAVATWLKVAEADPLPEGRFVSEVWEVQGDEEGSGESGESPTAWSKSVSEPGTPHLEEDPDE